MALGDRDMTIFEAIRAGDIARAKDAVRATPECVNARGEHGWTPLHLIAALGIDTKPSHVHIAEELIANGADTNARTSNPPGWTPIHIIAMQGTKESLEVAKCLIRHGADLAATDKNGLDWSGIWQHGHEIRELLSRHSPKKT